MIWSGSIAAIIAPIIAAAFSPQLAWRDPVYIVAGFAGIGALAALFVQPMLAGGYLPGLTVQQRQKAHRALGIGLIVAVVAHVGGLWITSPPDVIDALLLVSPTPFSAWGVIAMWAIFATGCLALLRRRVHPVTWRRAHGLLAVLIVSSSVVHALLIDGTMEPVSKLLICALTMAAAFKAVIDRQVIFRRKTR